MLNSLAMYGRGCCVLTGLARRQRPACFAAQQVHMEMRHLLMAVWTGIGDQAISIAAMGLGRASLFGDQRHRFKEIKLFCIAGSGDKVIVTPVRPLWNHKDMDLFLRRNIWKRDGVIAFEHRR